MPKPVTIYGAVGDDKAPSKSLSANLARALGLWAGQVVEVTVKSKPRSISANNYYWGVVVEAVTAFVNERGYNLQPQDVHEKMLKPWFLPARVVEVPSRDDLAAFESATVYGTTRTDSYTFAQFVDDIRNHPPFAAEGLYIPEPNERLTGRTIHEPGGTRVTFADGSRSRAEAPDDAPAVPMGDGDGLSDAGRIQAQLAEWF